MNKEEQALAQKIMARFNSPTDGGADFTRDENLILERWRVHGIINEGAFVDASALQDGIKIYLQVPGYPFTIFGEQEIKKSESISTLAPQESSNMLNQVERIMKKIFISWSGETSHRIALALRNWLPTLVHDADPWVSSEDIQKGERWGIELSKQLDETSFGIICIDPTNVQSPWLNFEAGAISKSIEHGKIFPLLFGILPNDLRGPLAQFQVTTFDKDDIYRLIRGLNQAVGSSRIPPDRLYKVFEMTWPGLLSAVNEIKIPQTEQQTKNNPMGINAKAKKMKPDIPEPDLLILQTLAGDNYLSIPTITARTQFVYTKVSYCLSRLTSQGFVDQNPAKTYFITAKGVGLLVDNEKI